MIFRERGKSSRLCSIVVAAISEIKSLWGVVEKEREKESGQSPLCHGAEKRSDRAL